MLFKLIFFTFVYLAQISAQTLNDQYRLPRTIIPIQYNISLRTYLVGNDADRLKFDGSVVIKVQVNETTNKMMLHTKGLTYQVRQYSDANEKTFLKLTNFEYNEKTNIIIYTLPNNLIAGQIYLLHFEYYGQLSNDMLGFYYSTYVDSNNQKRLLASTQFAANHARNVFPCWDEPSFKATFNVDITRPKGFHSYTNTPLLNTAKSIDSYEKDTFEETPIMSTYLNCFLIAEFEKNSNGTYSVIARPEYIEQTNYALEIGPQILDLLSAYFGVDYYDMGLKKMDLAAIPDFYFGAMENWGLITYKEFTLLYDASSSPLSSRQLITSIITHEQTHLWFGDLVTCDWWSYTWLNEGFANYFEYMAMEQFDNSFEMEKQYVVDELQTVLLTDSLNSTNPLNNINMDTPSLIKIMYNSITYQKGGSFIRMVKHVLGEKNFQKSIRKYFQERKFKTAVPQNMFDYWTENFPTQFKGFTNDFFNSFTWQVGYPLISITVASDRKSFEIQQKRFLLDSTDGSDTSILYTVPFTYTTSIERNFIDTSTNIFLPPFEISSLVKLNEPISWIIGNIQEVGYYRVNYDAETWKHIRQALNSVNWSSIHELNRAQIVDDLFNLARADEMYYDKTLDILEYLATETNYLPWVSAFEGFSFLSKRLGTNIKNFSNHILKLTTKVYKQLGFIENSNDTPLDILLRALIIQWSCRAGSKPCIETAKSYFQNSTSTPVPSNIRLSVYCVGMREGSEEDYDWLVQKYKTEKVATEISLILAALGCVKNETVIKKHFELILSDAVRLQDKSKAMSSLTANNNENVTPVFRLVTANYVALAKAMGGYSAVASVISNIAERFTTESQLEELKTFNEQERLEFGDSGNSLFAAEKKVIKNLAWSASRLGLVEEYLEKSAKGSSSRCSVTTWLTFVLATFIVKFFA